MRAKNSCGLIRVLDIFGGGCFGRASGHSGEVAVFGNFGFFRVFSGFGPMHIIKLDKDVQNL